MRKRWFCFLTRGRVQTFFDTHLFLTRFDTNLHTSRAGARVSKNSVKKKVLTRFDTFWHVLTRIWTPTEPELGLCFLTRFDTRGCQKKFDTYSRARIWESLDICWPCKNYGDPYIKGPKRQFFLHFSQFFGPWGGRASGRLDHGLENPSGEAALAADLITAFLASCLEMLIGPISKITVNTGNCPAGG